MHVVLRKPEKIPAAGNPAQSPEPCPPLWISFSLCPLPGQNCRVLRIFFRVSGRDTQAARTKGLHL